MKVVAKAVVVEGVEEVAVVVVIVTVVTAAETAEETVEATAVDHAVEIVWTDTAQPVKLTLTRKSTNHGAETTVIPSSKSKKRPP